MHQGIQGKEVTFKDVLILFSNDLNESLLSHWRLQLCLQPMEQCAVIVPSAVKTARTAGRLSDQAG